MHEIFQQVLDWVARFGYSAVVPALLLDPGGIPWPWVCLMAVAGQTQLNVFLMMAFGVCLMTLCDHAFYFLGVRGGRPLLKKVGARFPQIESDIGKAEEAIRRHDLWTVIFGRFLPIIGRFVGVGAALAGVSYARFAFCDLIGVLITVVGFGVVAQFVGRKALEDPRLQTLIAFVMATGILFAVGAALWQFLRMRRAKSTAQTPAE
jgi:membrane protein DedA with SNARE-associated domain